MQMELAVKLGLLVLERRDQVVRHFANATKAKPPVKASGLAEAPQPMESEASRGAERRLELLCSMAPHTTAAELWPCIVSRTDQIYDAVEELQPIFNQVVRTQ